MEPATSSAAFLDHAASPSAMLVEWSKALQNLPDNAALLILPLFIIIAIVINFIFTHWLKRLANRTSSNVDDIFVDAITRPLYWSFIYFGIISSIVASDVLTSISPFINKALLSLLILIWTKAMAQVVIQIIDDIYNKTNPSDHTIEKSMVDLLKSLSRVSIYSIGVIFILGVWGVNLAPIIASLGILSAAIAFGAKDAVANFVGSIAVLTDKPFKVGDVVVIQEIYKGKVMEIGLRSTRIQTFDKVLITVPNSIMANDVVINQTGSDPRSRISVAVGVSYDSDLNKVESILHDILNNNPEVLDDPSPYIRYKEFADSSINVKLYAFVESSALKGPVKHDLIKTIHHRFQEENLEIPFPQRVLHNN